MRQILCGFSLALLELLSACGADTSPANIDSPAADTGAWRLPQGFAAATLKTGSTLTTYGSCGIDGPACPAHTDCAVVFLDTGAVGPSCVPSNICEILACRSGNCMILESYPGQVLCGK